MDADGSWTALMRPGSASCFFAAASRARPLGETTAHFSPSDAWWLAELSRLIYRSDRSEPGPARTALLREQGLAERLFMDGDGGRCALIVPRDARHTLGGVLVFCGTRGVRDGLADLDAPLVTWRGRGRVHRGFREIFEKIRPRLEQPLASVAGPIYFTGHSMGGAVAAIAAAWRAPHALYTFGAPRVGDEAFAGSLQTVPAFRVVNGRDIVTTLPPALPVLPYVHVGSIQHLGRRHEGAADLMNDRAGTGYDGSKSDADGGSSALASWQARWSQWTNPPGCLADHAPANYLAQLAPLLSPDA